MSLTRLTDREKVDENGVVVTDKEGNPKKIRRFGLWGTTAEVEIDGKKVEVVHQNGSRQRFRTKEDAEAYMKTLIAR